MLRALYGWFKKEDGQGMVEYALIIALVAIAVIGVIGLMTGQLSAVFEKIRSTLTTAVSG